MRCESKDLSIPETDPPLSFTFQFIDVSLNPSTIEERPREHGVKLLLAGTSIASAEPVVVPDHEPFRAVSSSPRVSRMSTTIKDDEVSVLFGPHQSFNSAVENAIRDAIQRCKGENICAPIKIAVSVVKEIDVLRAIDDAHQAGIPVDIITNSGERSYYPSRLAPYPIKVAPWNWTKGNRHLGPFRGVLQMHTKFVIIGEDLAISSNVNLVNDSKWSSRGLTLVYRNRAVVKMFQALFTAIRSGISYPLTVDRRDNFALLVNAERPRRYVASAQRPFTIIRTEDGVVSSAYGILLEEIAETPGRFSLYMSPITDSCFSFQRQRCFLDELYLKASQGKLNLGLSGTFYLAPETSASKGPIWSTLDLKREDSWHPRAKGWLSFFSQFPDAVSVFTDRWGAYTVHHERFGVLGEDTLVSGSANFVFPFSLNTVELIRSRALVAEIQRELDTYDEPLFVAQGAPNLTNYGRVEKNCLFFFERSIGGEEVTQSKVFSGDEVLELVKKRGFAEGLNQVRLVVPTSTTLKSLSPNDSFESREITASFDSPSSYVCLWRPDTGASLVARLTPIR